MLLTSESPRARWAILLGVWALCAALVLLHTAAVRDYVALLDAAGTRQGAEVQTPLRQVIPARHADAQTWVRHAIAADEANAARVRFTTTDNAPLGREVHWSSAFLNLLRGGARLQAGVSAVSGPAALERTLLWFNAPLLIAVMILLSAYAARRAGAGAGVIVACGMVGHHRFYEGFSPVYVDHHGLVTAAVFGLLLGLAFMGGGWAKTATDARRAAIFSAICGAAGLWLSAAAVLPVIALSGAATLMAAWLSRAPIVRAPAQFDPRLWQLWGRVGAIASIVFYFLEYAPSHLGLRLEVNHPLWSLAWWGGAEIVAASGGWLWERACSRQADPDVASKLAPTASRVLLPSLAVLAAPLTILVGGRSVFLVSDPFVGPLRHFVAEGRSLPAVVAQSGAASVGYHLASTLLMIIAVVAAWRRRNAVLVVFALICGALTAMAFFEMRWWMNVAAAQLVLLLLVASVVPRFRWASIAGGCALLFLLPAFVRVATDRAENRRNAVAAGDLLQPLYRDLAAGLRESQPEGDIVLLANPNASAGIAYFGRFQSIGTLYWENAPGLRAAAQIFSARSDADALALIRARKITHVAMLSTANFLGEYFQLLHPDAPAADAKSTFGYRLLDGQPPPTWLQAIAYRPPADLKEASKTIRLFKVAPDQTPLEHDYHFALAQLAAGEIAAAEQTLEAASAHVPANGRAEFFETAGAAFYDYGADAAAVRQFRRVLERARDPNVANTVAWILATTRDDTLRDGRAALALAEPIARQNANDPTALSTFAAACAEVGRFAEAVTAAERALAAVRGGGDAAAAELLQRRLEAYRAGKPWRQ